MLRVVSQRSYCVLLDSTAGPPVSWNVWELQKDPKPVRPGRGMCFDHAFAILGLYEVQPVPMRSDWWTLSPACWGESRRLARARKHIPPPHDADMRDMLHCLGPEMLPLNCGALPQRAKQMWTVHCVFIGSTSSRYVCFSFVYLKMLWEFHWTWFSLSFCFPVAFFLTIHATFWFGVDFFFCPDHTTCSAEMVPLQS